MEIETYPVVPIPTRFDARENRGTRTKFWMQIEGGTDRWLFKIPRGNTGEHWAEKVAAELGCLVGIECAQVELTRYVDEGGLEHGLHRMDEQEAEQREPPSWFGTICKSFVPDVQLEDEEHYLFHGWEVLQWAVESYDTNLRFGQRDHNIKNITVAMADLMAVNTQNSMPHWDRVLEELVSYALLDGLIGNTDRHHENWMIAAVVYSDDMRIRVLPSFDHASSLGRELTDDRRRNILESDGVLRYLKRGRGAVYVDSKHERALSPLRLARLLCRWRPGFARRTLDQIASASDDEIQKTIQRVPPEFMSDMAKEFACQVVTTSKQELLRSVR